MANSVQTHRAPQPDPAWRRLPSPSARRLIGFARESPGRSVAAPCRPSRTPTPEPPTCAVRCGSWGGSRDSSGARCSPRPPSASSGWSARRSSRRRCNGPSTRASSATTPAGCCSGVACCSSSGPSARVTGALRHRFSVTNWLAAAFRGMQLVGYKTADTGQALPRTMPTGEVVATVASDAMRVGGLYDVSARFVGAIVSYVVVAVLLLTRLHAARSRRAGRRAAARRHPLADPASAAATPGRCSARSPAG